MSAHKRPNISVEKNITEDNIPHLDDYNGISYLDLYNAIRTIDHFCDGRTCADCPLSYGEDDRCVLFYIFPNKWTSCISLVEKTSYAIALEKEVKNFT